MIKLLSILTALTLVLSLSACGEADPAPGAAASSAPAASPAASELPASTPGGAVSGATVLDGLALTEGELSDAEGSVNAWLEGLGLS